MMFNAVTKLSVARGFGARLIHTSLKAQATVAGRTLSKSRKKLLSIEKKKHNKASQAAKEAQMEKVDPVLGRPNNPFIHRLRMEVEEPSVLSNGYDFYEVEKLLYGAKDARLLKTETKFGKDNEMMKKVESEEVEKREIVMRILSMKNAPNPEKEKKMTEMAVKEFQRFDGDTGSSEVQAAVMTIQIYNMMNHVKQHPQDVFIVRRVRMLTQKRQKILRYLKRDDPKRYFWCIEKLGLTDHNVFMEFNFDKKYSEEFNVWPGRRLVKITKQANEERRKQRRAAKIALRRAVSEGKLKDNKIVEDEEGSTDVEQQTPDSKQ